MALFSSLERAISRPRSRVEAQGDDDTDLVGRSQAGDLDAFNLLVERHQARVYGLCFRMLGDADAADATQEVFLSAWRSIHRFRGGSFIAWLLRIATNECHDQLRVRKRRPHVSLDLPADAVDAAPLEPPDPGEAPDDRLLRMERSRELERRLQALPADFRLVVILSDIHGYSYDEIVAATGWPLGTVKSRLSRGRRQLRAALRAEPAQPA